MTEPEIDVAGLRLVEKERVDVSDEGHKVGLPHLQAHLPFVYLAQVHHLVDE